jgi:hypothetical protein
MFNYDCAPGVKVSHKFLYPYSEIQLPKKQPEEYVITRRHTRGGAKLGKKQGIPRLEVLFAFLSVVRL